jgi:hypothetical protein
MNTLALFLTTSLLAPTASSPQLFVRDSNDPAECKGVAGAQPGEAKEARADDVVDDLGRYFGRFSVQVTSILDAAWHGRVHFCSRQAEVRVARAFSQLVVKPRDEGSQNDSQLPGGAESLLTALASDVLVAELEATPAFTYQEIERKAKALAIVRAGITPGGPQEDVVVKLDSTPTDKVAVHFGRHAAVYSLPREARDFAAQLECLRQSLADGTRVRFTYDVAGQVLTSVQCVAPQASALR